MFLELSDLIREFEEVEINEVAFRRKQWLDFTLTSNLESESKWRRKRDSGEELAREDECDEWVEVSRADRDEEGERALLHYFKITE